MLQLPQLGQNRQQRQRIHDELAAFLASTSHQPTLLTCTPEDLLVYLEMVYTKRHAGSLLPNGVLTAAPSSITNAISHMRLIFKELNRGEEWNDTHSYGNPAAAWSSSSNVPAGPVDMAALNALLWSIRPLVWCRLFHCKEAMVVITIATLRSATADLQV